MFRKFSKYPFNYSFLFYVILLTLNFLFFTIVNSSATTRVSLEWVPNSEPDLAGYRVFFREKGQPYDYNNPSLEVAGASCDINNLDENKTYYFVIRAFDTKGFDSGDSNEVCLEAATKPNSQPPTANQPPIAIITENYIEAVSGTTVTLDGTRSTDAEDGIASYHWSQIDGPSVTLSDQNSVVATFTPTETDQYGSNLNFRLTLTDFGGLQSTADCSVYITPENEPETVILGTHFDHYNDGFSYVDDAFRNTSQTGYADGAWTTSGGFTGGALQITLGGIDKANILAMSGGWQRDFALSIPTEVVLSFRYNLIQTPDYEYDELSQILVSVDHILYGEAPNDYVVQIQGNGNGGSSENTGWHLFEVNLGILEAGDHTLIIGAYNNKKTYYNESTEVLIDDVLVKSFAVSNQAPDVDARSDRTITLPVDNVFLDASVTDDGLPTGVLTTVWNQLSGPTNQVMFDDAYAIKTTATFLSAGTYVLQLTVNDGEFISRDEVTVFVNVDGEGGVTVEVPVAAKSDDAEERSSGTMYLGSTDLELIYDNSGNQTVGIRFNRIDIPQGATIVNAYVQFKVDETSSGPTFLTIEGENIDNAMTFASYRGNISSRARTSTNVSWFPLPWTTVGEAGPDQRTPDVSRIIQEIVNRPGWSSGNSLVFIITGTGKRVAESYNGDRSGAPMLHVEYAN